MPMPGDRTSPPRVRSLRGYQALLGIGVELRVTKHYPVWRAIVVDNEKVMLAPSSTEEGARRRPSTP